MPFDPTFTPEEAIAAIEKDPTIIDRITPVLTGRKFVVRSEADNTTYEQNLRNEAISGITKTHADTLEKDVFEITGEKKAADTEKYYEYNKRVLGTLATRKKELEDEINQLKGKSNITDAEREQLNQAKEGLKIANKEIETLKTKHAEELTAAKSEGKILMAVASTRAKYLKTIPEDVIKTTEGVFTAQILKEARFTEKGELYFVGADGKTPLLNDKTREFVTPEERYAEVAKSIIDGGQKQPGAGGNGGPTPPAGGGLPASVKTQVAATEHLNALGLVQGTKEFTAKWNELQIEKLPLR